MGYDTKISAEELSLAAAPSLTLFENTLAARLRRDALSSASSDEFQRKKMTNMQFCLAEAARSVTRKWIENAVMISVMQDVRAGNLLMRYCAVDEKLSVHRGLLGSLDVEKTETITNILQAMKEIVRQATCSGFGGPSPRDQPELYASFCQKVTMFVADAASNEQGAGRLSKSVFPNIISHQKDRAHATQRVLQRPWEAIDGLKQVLDTYVFGSDSVVQKIHHSNFLQDVYSEFCKALDPQWQKRIRHLKAAKHRFASCTQPLQRTVVYLDACISTVVWISTQRDGQDKQNAFDFLDAICERDLILIAMMADLADECSQLLRMVDTENYDIAEFPAEVEALIARMHHLVNKGNIFWPAFIIGE